MPTDAETLFAWHLQPAAAQRMIPPWLKMKILSSEGSPADSGSILELGIRTGPFWQRWIIQRTECKWGEFFIDQQIKGPFSFWRHIHRTTPHGEQAVLADEIEFSSQLSSWFPWLHARLVQELAKGFNWRQDRLYGDLVAYSRYSDDKMRILVSGASGLLGTNLVSFLRAGGHTVVRLVRKQTRDADAIFWNPENGGVPPEQLEGFTAVVHLAGSNIGAKRWTPARKNEIFQSRCRDTWLLSHALVRLKKPPAIFISASAVGFYGDQGDRILTEGCDAGSGFAADLCRQWERASEVLETRGTRVVHARLGAVLSPAGGMLQRMLPLFRLGLGAVLGNGDQWLSWIGCDDAVDALYHVLKTHELRGAVNLTAPQCIRNRDFALSLARACNAKLFLRLPPALLGLAFGEISHEFMLASQRVFPEKLIKSGFVFRTPEIDSALTYL